MKAYVGSCVVGVFAFDVDKNILTYKLFDASDPEKIAEKLSETSLIQEEQAVLKDLVEAGYREVSIGKQVSYKGLSMKEEKDNLAAKVLKDEFRKFAIDLQFVQNQVELNQLLAKVNILLTKEKLRRPEQRDKILMSVIGIIDELDKTTNTFCERLRELYGIYAPEFSRQVSSNEKFVELVAEHDGDREKIREAGGYKLSGKSAGMELEKADLEEIQKLASIIDSMYKERDTLGKYLEKSAKEIAPNMTGIAGAYITARILQLAGGLEKVARMPSSTVQLIGAEKALFRHLKGGGKPPKFGVLFAHQYIQNAKPEVKGKVARLIAAKLSLASKIDFYSKRDDSEKMKKELGEEIGKT